MFSSLLSFQNVLIALPRTVPLPCCPPMTVRPSEALSRFSPRSAQRARAVNLWTETNRFLSPTSVVGPKTSPNSVYRCMDPCHAIYRLRRIDDELIIVSSHTLYCTKIYI